MKKIIVSLISFYQQYLSFDRGVLAFLAPGGACKHSPSCSEYTKQMVEKYGIIQGMKLGGQRIISCK
ncbi:MAG: membrane protein insertion efficiency factor YidD [Patescibacteria group bacterium]|nr:membrane protein insertion efficiency factor YidD [Patescibacteria group bacterium]